MKVMILAAGRGKRLAPLTDNCPKPLVKVAGKPLIVRHLEALKRSGFEEFVINVSYMKQAIMDALGDGSDFGVQIRYSVEDCALETGGGIRHALALLGPSPFMIINADIVTDYPFELLKVQPSHMAHLVLAPKPHYSPEGDFGLKDHLVCRRNVKDVSHTYTGIAVLRPELFLRTQSDAFPLAPLLHQAVYGKEVTGELYEGLWKDIGTLERLETLDQTMTSKKSANMTQQG